MKTIAGRRIATVAALDIAIVDRFARDNVDATSTTS